MHRPKIIAWKENEENIVFSIRTLSFDPREDDLIEYDNGSGSVQYKVEGVVLKLVRHTMGSSEGWKTPEFWVEVSEVV